MMIDGSPFLIGIAGGSGSGKSTVANMIKGSCKAGEITIIREDHYYRDLSHLPKREQDLVNFDHPDSLDSELMIQQMKLLSEGHDIKHPKYDFKSRKSFAKAEIAIATQIIIFDGILSFHHKELRDYFSLKLFIDVPADIRIIRRISRDVHQRGRDLDSVIAQYLTSVRPMHTEFVEPTRIFADKIIPWIDRTQEEIDKIISLLPTPTEKRLRND